MNERLRIRHTDAEGTLIRILGLVERRGYRILSLDGRDGSLGLEIAPRDPGRRLDVLAAQLRRLHDVTDVTPFPTMQSAA